MTYDAGIARLSARRRLGRQQACSETAGIAGSMVFAGGGFFFADQVTEGFAPPSSMSGSRHDVFFENRPAGTTNAAGRILLRGPSSVSGEPDRDRPGQPAPDGNRRPDGDAGRAGPGWRRWSPNSPLTTVTPRPDHPLRDAAGVFIEVGAEATLDGTAQSFIVGYDGLAFVTAGLGQPTACPLLLPDGTRCVADFAFSSCAGNAIGHRRKLSSGGLGDLRLVLALIVALALRAAGCGGADPQPLLHLHDPVAQFRARSTRPGQRSEDLDRRRRHDRLHGAGSSSRGPSCASTWAPAAAARPARFAT